jgi:hypothetical protein
MWQIFIYHHVLCNHYHPIVPAGAAWFDQIENKRDLELLRATPYENSVVGL